MEKRKRTIRPKLNRCKPSIQPKSRQKTDCGTLEIAWQMEGLRRAGYSTFVCS